MAVGPQPVAICPCTPGALRTGQPHLQLQGGPDLEEVGTNSSKLASLPAS